VRHRLVTLGMYGLAFSVLGVYLYASHREEVNEILGRLSRCEGCRRRKEAVTAMMRQAQEAVGIVHDD
jgi:hypothetical protein